MGILKELFNIYILTQTLVGARLPILIGTRLRTRVGSHLNTLTLWDSCREAGGYSYCYPASTRPPFGGNPALKGKIDD